MNKVQILLSVLFFISIAGFNVKADNLRMNNEIQINYKKAHSLDIASKGINRISFWPMRIEKVIGDLSMFTPNVPDNGSELFLTSKLKSGHDINLTIMLNSGLPIDLTLKVVEALEPKHVEFDFKNYSNEDIQFREEVECLINSMLQSVKGKYYVKKSKKPILIVDTKTYTITQVNHYQYGKILGSTIEIKNKTKKPLEVNNSAFLNNFRNLKAYAFEGDIIQPKSKTKAYIVFKGDSKC